MVLTEMVDRGIDHNLAEPALEGAYRVGISWLEAVNLYKNFQEPVIEDLGCVFVVVGITVADRHGIPVERAVYFFLALPVVQGTSPDMYFQFLLRQQIRLV